MREEVAKWPMKGQKPRPGSASTEHAALGSASLMKHFQHWVIIVGNHVQMHVCAHMWRVCVCACLGGCDLPSEWAAVVLELKNRPSPKSPSFTTPVAVMNTLAGLMSDRREEED